MEAPSQTETPQNQDITKMTKMKPIHYLMKDSHLARFSRVNLQSVKSIDNILWRTVSNLDRSRGSNPALKRLTRVMKSAKNIQNLTLCFYSITSINKQCFDLTKILKNFSLLQEIDLTFGYMNQITDMGIYSLSQSLKEVGSLNSFRISIIKCPKITDKSYYYLVQGLKRLLSLHALDLSLVQSPGITDRGLGFLGQGLKRINSLEWVSLSFEQCEHITDAGLSRLSESLDCFKRLDGLERFDLKIKSNNITDIGMERLGNSFKNLTSLQVTVLEIESWSISDRGLTSLGAGLMGLRSLIHPYFIFNFSLEVTESGFDQFFKSLSQMVQLKSIQLDSNGSRKWNNKELGSLSRALKTLSCLECLRLSFSNNEFTDQGLIDLSKGLRKLHLLEELNIRFSNGGNFSNYGLKHLGKELRKLPILKSININFKSMQQVDVTDLERQDFIKEVKKISCLKTFYLFLPMQAEFTNKGRCKMLYCLKRLGSISFHYETGKYTCLRRYRMRKAWKEFVEDKNECYLKKKKSMIFKGIYMLFFCVILHMLCLYVK